MVRDDSSEEVAFEMRPERFEETSQLQGESIPDIGNNKYKDLGSGQGAERKGRRGEGRSEARGLRRQRVAPGRGHRPGGNLGAVDWLCGVTFGRGQLGGAAARSRGRTRPTAANAVPRIPAELISQLVPGQNAGRTVSAARIRIWASARRRLDTPPPPPGWPQCLPRRPEPASLSHLNGEPVRRLEGSGSRGCVAPPGGYSALVAWEAPRRERSKEESDGWRLSLGGWRRRRRRRTPTLRSGEIHPPPGGSAAAAADHFRGAGEGGGAAGERLPVHRLREG
uniref:uncharacterized protein LOC103794686 n=1 Tax=Callithrix jacchus TaxID=9483 RepID=UPI0023DD5783|nr:uncharacterized protein LOC103794686 [Callithrix jacchus]